MRYLLMMVVAAVCFVGCGDDDEGADFRAENETAIQQYLAANNLTSQSTSSGLHYIVQQSGNGTFPTSFSSVTVNYVGYDINGQIFDQNDNITFNLAGTILGWQEGIPKFSEGGSGILLVPAHLAYNSSPPSNNGVIIFEVNLISVN